MQPKRQASVWLLAALLCGGATGCQRTLPPPELPPYQGVEVRIACPESIKSILSAQTRVWQASQQARATFLPLKPGQSPESIPDADIWFMPPADLSARVVTGQVIQVPEEMTKRGNRFGWPGLLPEYREQLLVWDRTSWAVPVAGEAPVCLFRADLFSSDAWQKRFHAWQQKQGVPPAEVAHLHAPSSWEEFVRMAEFFRQEHPSGKPAPSLPPLPADEAELDRLFYTVAACYARRAVRQEESTGKDHLALVFSFHYDQKTGQPRIATPGFVEALRVLARMQACRPARPSPRPEQAFLDGEAVLCLADASLLMRAQKVRALRDNVGVCRIPGSRRYFTPSGKEETVKVGSNRIPYLGGAGWLACVSARSRQPEAAWSLLADLAGPERSAQLALEPRWGGPTRTEQVLRERWDGYDLDLSRTLALKDALGHALLLHGIKNPVLCLRTPDQASHRRALVAGVRRVLLDKADPAASLTEVAKQWTALDEKRGMERHLREYRISLGLLGR